MDSCAPGRKQSDCWREQREEHQRQRPQFWDEREQAGHLRGEREGKRECQREWRQLPAEGKERHAEDERAFDPEDRQQEELLLRDKKNGDNVKRQRDRGQCERRLLAIVGRDQLRNILRVVLDENEFLSPMGLRALSRYHLEHPFTMETDGTKYCVDYEPAESTTGLFGGNSNWRGPIWFPVNYLFIESLQRFDFYFGPSFQVECPTGSGIMMTLGQVAAELSKRLTRLFVRDENGRRPVHGGDERYATDPHWRDLVLFYEYFHGDNGAGLGANHQTGWTGLVAKMMQQSGE